MSGAAAAASVWGGLSVGGMKLALPLQALREVLPCRGLRPLPCAAAAVVGGLEVRGVIVPVLDLALHLGRSPVPSAGDCVVVLSHGGRLLGLRADGVDGVFSVDSAQVGAATPGLAFAGSLQRGDGAAAFALLSVEALAADPALPWIVDHEPGRQAAGDAAAGGPVGPAADDTQALMLLRSGPLHLAMDALQVHATLWNPCVQPSVMRGGACRGVVRHGGHEIAALDLAELIGLGALPAGTPCQALVTRTAHGQVALLVEQISDIARVPRGRVVPLPRFALPSGCPVAGACERELLQQAGTGLAAGIEHDHLVLDTDALLALPLLQELARAQVPVAGAATAASIEGVAAGPADGLPVITVPLPGETAIAMEQVVEILPLGAQAAAFGPDQALRRFQLRRGRAVPVYSLARLNGVAVDDDASTAVVLVVEHAEQPVGFAVPALRSMERASAVQTLPAHALGGAAGQARVATLGEGATRRTVRLLDLHALAARLAGAAALPA